MKNLSLLFLTIIFITPIQVSAGKSNNTDARNKKSLNNIRRCPGTNLMFKYKLDRKEYFKETFSARPIEKTLSNVTIYRCGIEGCSSVKTTFSTKIKCWHHMLIATQNHNEQLIKSLSVEPTPEPICSLSARRIARKEADLDHSQSGKIKPKIVAYQPAEKEYTVLTFFNNSLDTSSDENSFINDEDSVSDINTNYESDNLPTIPLEPLFSSNEFASSYLTNNDEDKLSDYDGLNDIPQFYNQDYHHTSENRLIRFNH